MIARHDRDPPPGMNDSRKLPERVDPRRLAATGGTVAGEVAIAGLARLADRLAPDWEPSDGRAALSVSFGEDAQRRILMDGGIQATLVLQCQRCLEPFQWPVEQTLRLIAIADDEAAAQVPRDREPVIVPPEGLDPVALAEDELLLALPLAARCERPECRRGLRNSE